MTNSPLGCCLTRSATGAEPPSTPIHTEAPFSAAVALQKALDTQDAGYESDGGSRSDGGDVSHPVAAASASSAPAQKAQMQPPERTGAESTHKANARYRRKRKLRREDAPDKVKGVARKKAKVSAANAIPSPVSFLDDLTPSKPAWRGNMEKLPKEEKEKEYGLDELLNERGFRLVNYHTGDGALAFVDSEGLNVGLTLVEGSFKVEFPRISYHPLWPRYFDVLMPRLTSLRLKLTNPSLDTSFFFYLRVPGLQTLRLEKFDDYAGWDFSMFDPFMMHFTRTLRVLKLADFSPEVAGYAPPVRKRTQTRLREELERLFTILPHLEVLRLPSSIQVYDSTIEKLMNGLLLPPLTELELYTVNAEQTLWMVKGRNFLSEYYRLQPGSSRRASEVVSRMNVERFRLVKLWVDDCEVESVRVASQMLAPASTLSIGSCRL